MSRPIWEMAQAIGSHIIGDGVVMTQVKVAVWTVDGPPPSEEALPVYYGWDEAIAALLKDGWEPVGQDRTYVQGQPSQLNRLFKRLAKPEKKMVAMDDVVEAVEAFEDWRFHGPGFGHSGIAAADDPDVVNIDESLDALILHLQRELR